MCWRFWRLATFLVNSAIIWSVWHRSKQPSNWTMATTRASWMIHRSIDTNCQHNAEILWTKANAWNCMLTVQITANGTTMVWVWTINCWLDRVSYWCLPLWESCSASLPINSIALKCWVSAHWYSPLRSFYKARWKTIGNWFYCVWLWRLVSRDAIRWRRELCQTFSPKRSALLSWPFSTGAFTVATESPSRSDGTSPNWTFGTW